MSEIVEKSKTAVVNQVQKKIRMDIWDIVKFQLMIHCYLGNINIPELELNCLTFLTMTPDVELGEFCILAVKENISASQQSVRNLLAKLEKKGLITKTGKSKKRISVNHTLTIQTSGNILLDYKVLRIDPQGS